MDDLTAKTFFVRGMDAGTKLANAGAAARLASFNPNGLPALTWAAAMIGQLEIAEATLAGVLEEAESWPEPEAESIRVMLRNATVKPDQLLAQALAHGAEELAALRQLGADDERIHDP